MARQQQAELPQVWLVRDWTDRNDDQWRTYRNAAGQEITVHARGAGFRRAAKKADTARTAALGFAGYL